MDFPYARSVVVVRSQRHIKKSGETSQETRNYVSSLDPGETSLENWHRLIRGHWAGVEIRNHWRRDVLKTDPEVAMPNFWVRAGSYFSRGGRV